MKRGFFRSKESQELVPMTGPAVAEEATPMGPNPGEDLLPVVDRLTMYGDAVANKIDVHCWRNAEGVIVFEAPLPIGEDPHELFETNRSIMKKYYDASYVGPIPLDELVAQQELLVADVAAAQYGQPA
jgi:hypothetical protein